MVKSEKKWQRPMRQSSLSHAVWPIEVQRGPATNTLAQLRRTYPLAFIAWLELLTFIERIHFFYLCLIVGAGLSALTELALLLYNWPIELTFFAVSGILISSLLFRIWPRTRKRQRRRYISASIGAVTPETPLPQRTLVRVLETIDLSSCSIEHFIELSDTDQLPLIEQSSPVKVVVRTDSSRPGRACHPAPGRDESVPTTTFTMP